MKYSVKGGLEIEFFYWFKNENFEKKYLTNCKVSYDTCILIGYTPDV